MPNIPTMSLEDLELHMHHRPSNEDLTFCQQREQEYPNNSQQSLSYIPWAFSQSFELETTPSRSNNRFPSTKESKLQISTSTNDLDHEKKFHEDTDKSIHSTASSKTRYFPTMSYLDLRRHQNIAWADDRLAKGKEQFYQDPIQADQFFQEGLDLIPDHVNLLATQAKLWILKRNRPHAARKQLEYCLHVDSHHALAQDLLDLLHRREKKNTISLTNGQKRNLPQTKESSAYQDALMERNLLTMDKAKIATGNYDTKDAEKETDDDSSVSSSSPKRRSKKRNKKHKSKRKSKRRRKKYEKRKRRKRRRNHDLSSPSSSSSSSSSLEASFSCSANKLVSNGHHKRPREVDDIEIDVHKGTMQSTSSHDMQSETHKYSDAVHAQTSNTLRDEKGNHNDDEQESLFERQRSKSSHRKDDRRKKKRRRRRGRRSRSSSESS